MLVILEGPWRCLELPQYGLSLVAWADAVQRVVEALARALSQALQAGGRPAVPTKEAEGGARALAQVTRRSGALSRPHAAVSVRPASFHFVSCRFAFFVSFLFLADFLFASFFFARYV